MCSDTADKPIISVRNLSKKYPIYGKKSDRLKEAFHPLRKKFHRDFWALKNVSFEVSRGETFGIIGVNGSGKSTLLGIICGVLRSSEGESIVHGRISALLELGSGFNPEFSGRENVYLQGAILGYSREEIEKRFDCIVNFADIGDFLDQPVKTYSSGMIIRLAFSVAINVDPDILVVDEALAVGDIFFQTKCYSKFEELKKKGVTILFVSHDLATVTALCNRALLLDAGEAVFEGSPKDTINTYYRIRSNVSGSVTFPPPAQTVSSVDRPDETENTNKKKRYGNGKIVLDRYSIDGNVNCSEVFIKSGDLFVIELVHTVIAQVINPLIGIKITTHNGIELYGNNSLFNKDSLGQLESGSVIISKFTQTMDLNNGLYFLTVVSAELVNGKIVYADRIVDMVLLRVDSGPFPYAGLCNMNGKIRYEIR
jgi:ABC-type polysaccharide/polyol phosphate transport system ATPase subunit